MGLDMYLEKEIYIGANFDFNEITGQIDLKRKGQPIKIDINKITYIRESVAYWRKANHIHRWFVENIQNGNDDCKDYRIYGEDLLELVDLCKKVLENPELSEELLPTFDGFFFGGTDYGEYYKECLRSTIKQLENVDPDQCYVYTSSW